MRMTHTPKLLMYIIAQVENASSSPQFYRFDFLLLIYDRLNGTGKSVVMGKEGEAVYVFLES